MKTTHNNVMLHNLAVLRESLLEAAHLARAAHRAMREGNRPLALGTLLPMEQLLSEQRGLYDTIRALHRRAVARDNSRRG